MTDSLKPKHVIHDCCVPVPHQVVTRLQTLRRTFPGGSLSQSSVQWGWLPSPGFGWYDMLVTIDRVVVEMEVDGEMEKAT